MMNQSAYYRQWVGFYTIIIREIIRILRIWAQTLLPPAITTILYFVIFGHVIGSRIGQMQGFDYVTFIAPGLIIMVVINGSYLGTVSSFFSAKFQGFIEEVLITPMHSTIILLGYVMGGMVRGLLAGFIVACIALFFTNLHPYSLSAIWATALCTSCIFSLAGLLNGIYARTFDEISVVPTFVLTPLTYLGGVFYSIHLLPPFWQYVSLGNPIVYIVESFRYGFLGIKTGRLAIAYILMVLVIIILFFLNLRLIRKGIRTH